MIKKIFIVLNIFLLLGITGCSNEKNIIQEFSLDEGCYSKENDPENLICFTKDLSFYEVLHKYNKYYNDPYRNTSSEDGLYYKFDHNSGTITLSYYADNSLYSSSVCFAENNTTLKCDVTNIDLSNIETKSKEVYTKVDKEFNKDIIEKLPIFERNKEFNIVFNNETITCNLTHSYSVLNTAASLPIKKCLEKHFGKNYTITQMDKSGDWHIFSDIPNGADTDYILYNFSYKVTVNNKTFGYVDAFPVDPYSIDEKMTVKIEKVDKQTDIKEKYKNLAGTCYLQEHVNGVSWDEFNICFDEELTKAYTWKVNLLDVIRGYKSYNLTTENGVLQYDNVKIYYSGGNKITLDGESLLNGKDKTAIKFVYFRNSCGLQNWLGNSQCPY